MMRWALFALPLLLVPAMARGQVAVPAEDLKVFVQLAKDQKCRTETAPTFQLDPITVVVDKDGRVYGSGSDPKPYKVHVDWCNYHLDGAGQTKIIAAQRVETEWGFRFRVKAAMGLLPVTAIQAKSLKDGFDGGLLLEPFHWKMLNVSAYVGFRSFGGGIGVDITRNFGFHLGYANTWMTWQSNPHAALYFSFN